MKKLLSLDIVKVFIVFLSVIIITINIYSFNRVNDINKSFSNSQNEATWFVFQLMKEYANFLMVSQNDKINYDELWLAYDLTWSRFDILTNRNKSSFFINSTSFDVNFIKEFDKFKALESSIKLVSLGRLPQESLQKKIDICYHALLAVINEKFALQSPLVINNTSVVDKFVSVNKISSVLIILMLLITGVVFFIDFFVKQKLLSIDSLTGFRNRISLIDFAKNNYSKEQSLALYFVRIRNLSEINQKYGIEYGDLVVSSAAQSLSNHVPKGTVSFRFSGGHFVFFIPENVYPCNEIKETFNDVFSDYISTGNLDLMIDVVIREKRNISSRDIMELLTTMQA
ncbi:GGDEF domain-containing protein [Vibrio artabrorum]|uniref:GGDEF domain-containing protein n=1 Tax=Vibrio artabrorum TaxID=446374 RepID=UPI003553ED33